MGYPLSNDFSSAPVDGYTTTLGSMSASYNGAQQAIDLSAPNQPALLRINETAHGDFWFEAELELLSDASARKHIGLWLGTGDGAEGYRFAHLDNTWTLGRWNPEFANWTAVATAVGDGTLPISGQSAAAPGFHVGQRMVLRCELIAGGYDGAGVSRMRLMRFAAGGVLLFQSGDVGNPGKLIPGVFLYGARARLHAIAAGTPSGLPAFPQAIGVRADDALLSGGPGAQFNAAGAQIGVQAGADLAPVTSPASDLGKRAGGLNQALRAIDSARRNIHFGGNGVIVGTVKEKGQPNRPLVRRVQLISENTRVLVMETWSDATGAYRFELIDLSQRYTVISYDHKEMYRAVIADKLEPEAMS